MTTAGLYVHVPFCRTRCGYCDFNAYAGLGHLAGHYADALRRESELAASSWRDVRFVSVFFGGGTPTTLDPETLEGLLTHLRGALDIDDDAEVTIEANPDTVDPGSLERLHGAGFGRLSMGVQSFDPEVLRSLERVHGPESARRAYRAARAAGYRNVNLDLIFGAEGETVASWKATLEEAVALDPEHLSCYALTVEPATPLGRRVAAGVTPEPDPDRQASMFEATCELLRRAGYVHYEVSNWAKPGFQCRHNLGYWDGRPYLGLGAGAHSFRDGRRWWNVRPPSGYIEAVREGRLPVGGEERLEPDEVRLERTFLGLRTTRGLPADGVDPATVEPFVSGGLLAADGERLVLTERGMFLANDIALALAETGGGGSLPEPANA